MFFLSKIYGTFPLTSVRGTYVFSVKKSCYSTFLVIMNLVNVVVTQILISELIPSNPAYKLILFQKIAIDLILNFSWFTNIILFKSRFVHYLKSVEETDNALSQHGLHPRKLSQCRNLNFFLFIVALHFFQASESLYFDNNITAVSVSIAFETTSTFRDILSLGNTSIITESVEEIVKRVYSIVEYTEHNISNRSDCFDEVNYVRSLEHLGLCFSQARRSAAILKKLLHSHILFLLLNEFFNFILNLCFWFIWEKPEGTEALVNITSYLATRFSMTSYITWMVFSVCYSTTKAVSIS